MVSGGIPAFWLHFKKVLIEKRLQLQINGYGELSFRRGRGLVDVPLGHVNEEVRTSVSN